MQYETSLNPFEIRAGLLRTTTDKPARRRKVLIPSKSGLGCYTCGSSIASASAVLIPSKSGLGCYETRLACSSRSRLS